MRRSPALQQAETAFREGRAGKGRDILRDAAAAGDAAAGYSLAVALAYGQGGEIDLESAAAQLAQIRDQLPAARMFQRYAMAHGWDGNSQWTDALSDLLAAAKDGDPAAQREAGLIALMYRRDDSALALLADAAAQGDMPAAMALMRLGRARGQAWLAAATTQLQRARHPLAAELMAAADNDAPLPDLEPVNWPALADDMADAPPLPAATPLVSEVAAQTFAGVLPPPVGDHVMSSGLKALQPSTVVDEATGQRTRDPHRQSLSMTFASHQQDLVHVAVERLMARMADCPSSHTERLNLLFYRPGEQYRPHVDYFAPDDGGGAREIERAGQRVATSLICLHAATGGGATRFVRFDRDWKGAAGDGLSFRNVRPDGDIEPLSLHQGEEVTDGWKALASLWIREKAS